MRRLLILGGATEAAELARRAALRFASDIEVTTSLAGRLEPSQRLPGAVRVGGFGGADGLARHLLEARVDVLVDATHPFAARISRNAIEAAARAGAPLIRLVRPEWPAVDGDRRIDAEDFAHAARLLPGLGDCAFLTIGPTDLGAFAAVEGVRFLVRTFEPPARPPPLARCDVVVARPPFTVEGETRLMRGHGVKSLVTKNSGGPLTAKLDAARALGLPVVMIRRPPIPEGGLIVATVEDALAALAALAAGGGLV